MKGKKAYCKLCGDYCYNKDISSKYCKYCYEILLWFKGRKNMMKEQIETRFPKKEIEFRLIIDKIEKWELKKFTDI